VSEYPLALRAIPLEGFTPEFKTPSPYGHFPWKGKKYLHIIEFLLDG